MTEYLESLPLDTESKQVLSWLAHQLSKNNLTVFCPDDIQPSWLASPKQEAIYAISIGSVVGVLMGLLFIPVGGILGGLSIGLIFGLLAGLSATVDGDSSPPRWQLAIDRFSLLMSLVLGVIGTILMSLRFDPNIGLIFGLMVGCGVLVGVGFLSPRQTPTHIALNARLDSAFRTGLVMFFVVSLFGGLALGGVVGFVLGLFVAWVMGWERVVKYFSLLAFLRRSGKIPADWQGFLEQMVEQSVLERRNGGYAFRQNELDENAT